MLNDSSGFRLSERLHASLAAQGDGLDALASARPVDRRDRAASLLAIYDLHLAPLPAIGERARLQGHPAIAALKRRLEDAWIEELDATSPAEASEDPVDAMRALAASDRLPPVYHWLAKQARYDEMVDFLALEGGPDGGFDDLVALCQIGLDGTAKLELGHNYWDEMGNGVAEEVHTELHRDCARALALPDVPLDEQPVEALERSALGGLMATNRWLQPEMLGALGLIELQAGPRCRMVLRAFDRLAAPRAAYPFYEVHAEVDPRHGKDWLDLAITPLAAQHPEWGPRMVRGARWRWQVNHAFFAALEERFVQAAAA